MEIRNKKYIVWFTDDRRCLYINVPGNKFFTIKNSRYYGLACGGSRIESISCGHDYCIVYRNSKW